MALTPVEQVKERVAQEKRRLETGEKPKSRFSSKLQRTAARALAAFLALMVGLTLLSRAADGVTVARVQVQKPKTGILTQRLTVSGNITPLGDLALTLPGGILVSSIRAQQGDRVQAGDTLMELDLEDLAEQLTALREKLRIVNLRLEAAGAGTTSADTEAVLSAQQALEDAQRDYDRLVEKQGRTQEQLQQDLADAQAEYDKAVADYGKAEEKARKALVEAAEKEVEAAEKNLDSVKESAEMAIEGAQRTLDTARDAKRAYSEGYYNSVKSLDKLQDGLRAARKELEDLENSEDAGEEALAAAREKVVEAEAAVSAAQWNMDSYNYSSDLAVQRAQEDLKKVQERQEKKVQEAEKTLQEAQEELTRVEETADLTEEAAVVAAQSAIDSAQRAVKSAQRTVEEGSFTSEDQLYNGQRAIETARRGLETAQRRAEEAAQKALLDDAGARRQAEIERLGYLSEKRALTQSIADLERVSAAGGLLTAPVDGTVKSILNQPGQTQTGTQLAVLTRNDQGFVYEGQVAQEKAADLAVGDKGSLSYTSEGKRVDLEVEIISIGAADEKGQVSIKAALPEGTYPSGVAAELELSKRSEQYRSVLPLGAIRSENGDNFVLVLRETQTVMGAEQTVVKMAVTVEDQDSENAAVTGPFVGEEQVVVSANKPIGEGDRVRLETVENSGN